MLHSSIRALYRRLSMLAADESGMSTVEYSIVRETCPIRRDFFAFVWSPNQ